MHTSTREVGGPSVGAPRAHPRVEYGYRTMSAATGVGEDVLKRRTLFAVLSAALLLVSATPATWAADPRLEDRFDEAVAERLDGQRLSRSVERSATAASFKLDASLRSADGRKAVVIRLKAAPTVGARGAGAQRAQADRVDRQQQDFETRAKRIDASLRVLGRARVATNVVLAEVDAASLERLAADDAVLSIRPVRDYELDLTETVPYIGGTAAHELGFRGEGITVAVLDSGIDYTHADLGGPGTLEAYAAAYGTKTQHAKNTKINDRYKGQLLFPSDKVVGGYDFVGEAWPDGELAPDPDPIDCGGPVVKGGCDGGHGTHVGDIIAGEDGVAPDATLLAVKVCSAVSTSCSGVALLQGMDFALDPNGDGVTSDKVDIINMSLGSDYGQPIDDDLSAAVEAASAIGVLTVASAGNGSDKPYVAGTPANAPSALSVAQTSVPSATGFAMRIDAPAAIAGDYEAVFQPWSAPLTEVISGGVQYGDGAGGNLLGCEAFPAGSVTGKIVIVDRGDCNFTLKIANISQGGGILGIIAMVAPGDPFTGADGGDRPIDIPGYMVSQATGDLIQANLGTVVVTFDPENAIDLVGVMVGSSSRGPSMDYDHIKPEIGAPGGSVSAEVGTATDRTAFSGTSGAAPMVSGSAALLREAFPGRSPLEIKAVLMNTAETDILNRPEVFGGGAAPITRIGGGEVRVDRALQATAAAWDEAIPTGALSFGFHDLTKAGTLTRTVVVRNYDDAARTFVIESTFRFDADAGGAVTIDAPASVRVAAGATATFDVTLTIDPTALPPWGLDSGPLGADASALTGVEYDGYIWLDDTATSEDDDEPLHLPWQVLPRPVGQLELSAESVAPGGIVEVTNVADNDVAVEAYSLLATDADDADTPAADAVSDVDLRAIGVQTIPVPGGVCLDDPSFVLLLAVNTWDRQTHAVAPAFFEWDLDTDGDGVVDHIVYNADASGLGNVTDGRNLTWALDVEAGEESAFFFTDHRTHSANTVLYVCAEQLGMDGDDVGTPIEATVFAWDYYNSGTVRDEVDPVTFAPLGERYLGFFPPQDVVFATIGAGQTRDLVAVDLGTEGTNPDELGLLLRVVDGPAGEEAILLPVEE